MSQDLRIQLVLIHHGVENRVTAARTTVAVVAGALSHFGHVETSEVSRQPPPFRVDFCQLAARRMRQWMLERRWANHLGVSGRWFLSSGLLGLRLIQLLNPDVRRRASQRSFIELALTAKHGLAWRRAFEDEADVLVVLEDDARADATSVDRIRKLIQLAVDDGNLTDTYIDLAGGLSTEELRLHGVQRPREDGILRLSKPATNTACAYAMGRNVISRLAEFTIADPATGRVPADWLLNLCFLESEQSGVRISCLHSRPHALAHGSLTGAVASSIR